MDEVSELPLPKDFPSDPALGAVWAARSLVDTIGMMLVLNRGAKFPPEDFGRLQLRPLLSRFNRDLRELQARLPAINKLAAALHGMTGVRVADRQGTCYADIAESLGRSLQTAILVATNPAGLVQLNAGIFVPIDPDKAVAGWRQITVWFDDQSQALLEELEIALFNEHVAVDRIAGASANPHAVKPDGKVAHDTYRIDGREVTGLAPNEIKLLELVHTRADDAPNEADIIVAVWGNEEKHLYSRKDIDRLYPRVNDKLRRVKCKRRLFWSSKRMVARTPKQPAQSSAKKTARTSRGKRARTRRGKRVGKK